MGKFSLSKSITILSGILPVMGMGKQFNKNPVKNNLVVKNVFNGNLQRRSVSVLFNLFCFFADKDTGRRRSFHSYKNP